MLGRLAVRWLEWILWEDGKIRSWYWFSEYGMMVYNMSRNRYCEGFGREHKSNHGYRSPSHPISKDAIPDDTILFNFGSHNVGGSADENLEHQLVQNGQEHMKFYSDESITDSCRKDGWWIEAIRAAGKIENMPRTLDLTETATFTDILKQLAGRFKMNLTSRKSSIKLMIQDELTKLADEADDEEDETQPSSKGVKA